MNPLRIAFCLIVLAVSTSFALGAQIAVAVAANFTAPAREIAAAFTRAQGDAAVLSFGASGLLAAQIAQAAPFHVFLSADSERPAQLIAQGHAVAGSAFAYARGRLALWSALPGAAPSAQTLRAGAFAKLAICNPLAAPYGAAAVETLQALDLAATLKPKLVEGANIAQAFQFVDSGNAELGFVALSQVVRKPAASYWLVPENLHRPILQEAVLLKAGAEAPAARAFLDFLKGPEARAIIARYGYGAQAP